MNFLTSNKKVEIPEIKRRIKRKWHKVIEKQTFKAKKPYRIPININLLTKKEEILKIKHCARLH